MKWPDNKQLFRWHGWLGLNLGLLLFIVCFSGTIAVFSYEIDALIDPDMRVAVDPDRPPVRWSALQDSVQAAFPYHDVIFFQAPRHRGFASHVYATDPAGRAVKIYAHPQTGETLRVGSFWNVQRFFRSFHRRMFVPNPYGIAWITFFAFVLLASAATGIFFYKGWYRHLFRLRWHDPRLLFSDGHRLAGVWSLAFAILIIVTGVWYGVELVAPASTPGVPGPAPETTAEYGPVPRLRPLDEQVRIAEEAYPGLDVTYVWPGTPVSAAEMRGQAEAWFVRPRANRVRVHPVTGEVTMVQRATETPAYQRWSNMADPLHFGTFGGLWTQGLWFGFGLVLSSLMLTGGWLWHLRAEKKARTAGAGRHPRWSYAAAAFPMVLLLASGALGYEEARLGYIKPDATAHRLAERSLGPWTAHVVYRGPLEAGRDVPFSIHLFAEEGVPRFQQATLRLEQADGALLEKADVDARHPLQAELALPPDPEPAALALHVEAATPAETHALHIPLDSAGAARIDEGASAIPAAVWIVIGLFVTLTLAVVGAWLYLAQRAARRRHENEPAAAASSEAAPVEAIAIDADLPTPG